MNRVLMIKLTMSNNTGFGGEPIYISIAHIEAIRANDDGGSIVFVVGDNNARYFVKESPESIMAMIEFAQRGMNV